MKKLKIYFASDLHGYVYPTDYIEKDKKNIGLLNIISNLQKDDNTLIIDGGDTIQGSPFTNFLSGYEFDVHPMADIMNFAGYDYVTLGNHDFNYGKDYLKKYINNLNGKCLCCNVTSDEINILPFDIKTLGNGLKVGIMGFTTDFINRWERKENIENITINDTFSSIKKYFDEVKKNSDVIIGVYHGGFEYDLETHTKLSDTKENIAYKICKELDFDILLTGHQHIAISGEYLHNTYIVQTPHNATKFIELNLEIGENKQITSSLNDIALNPNKEMYNKFLDIECKVQDWLDTPVGHLDTELHPSNHLDMALNGSDLANFINQIQLEESNADISCTSFSNVVKGFDKNVTVRDVIATYIYPNTLVMKKINKKYLKLYLERCASYFDTTSKDIKISESFLKPKVEHYNYDYFSNIHYTFDLTKEVGERVVSIKFKNEKLKDDDTLCLVMNNYRASGAGGYEFLDECETIKEIMVEMPEVIINYFKNNKNVVVDKSRYLTIIK